MISKRDAYEKVCRFLKGMSEELGIALAVLEDSTREYSFGWVFFYQSKAYMQTGELSDLLAGNAPIIVDRRDGSLVTTGTALPLETYLDRYLEYGDPHRQE
ncbi:MAG: YrhB family protein [Thermoanaerobaculia bacterium]|nr:YrhB family protein [Thermoanaerobaculia bacterium]